MMDLPRVAPPSNLLKTTVLSSKDSCVITTPGDRVLTNVGPLNLDVTCTLERSTIPMLERLDVVEDKKGEEEN
jgi:hypothetical protein